MHVRWIGAALSVVVASLALQAALAEASREVETAVRELIARWYDEARKPRDNRWYTLAAPGAILKWPRQCECGEQPAMKPLGPPLGMAALVHKFDYEIRELTVNSDLAKARVWERGWSYAPAFDKTTERAVSTTFVMERQDDGRWLVLAHEPRSSAIHPDHKDDPMPDMKPVWEELTGGAAQ